MQKTHSEVQKQWEQSALVEGQTDNSHARFRRKLAFPGSAANDLLIL